MKDSRKYIIYLLYLFFILWFILAFVRTGYNFSKIFFEEKQWLSLSDEKKREKIFGENHNLFRLVESKTDQSSKIILISKDMKDYYVGRYYLYPRHLLYLQEMKDFNQLNKKNDYVLIYNNFPRSFINGSKIMAYKNIASLYKIRHE